MKYTRVIIEAIGYELAPVIVTSAELEERLAPLYEALHLPAGQLETLTGIRERRWWEKGYPLSRGAAIAARKALQNSNVRPSDLGTLIYAGVNRENFEPATACRVASELGIGSNTAGANAPGANAAGANAAGANAAIYDISNACLGVLNGMLEVANRIELGQIRAGLVVSCETAREINEIMIGRMLEERNIDHFTRSLATLTGGSGAAAVLLTDGSFESDKSHTFLGGVTCAAPEHHGLCRWGLDPVGDDHVVKAIMSTDAVSVLKHGVELGQRTWKALLEELGWERSSVDKVICHQVGAANRRSMLDALGIPENKEFPSYEFLGNMGTVSLPLTAALAGEREFLKPGDRVSFLGIGSGLNCLMLGFEW